MTEVPLEELLGKVGSIYKLVILASRRTLELNSGAPPLVEKGSDNTPHAIALQEIVQGRISYASPEEKKKAKSKGK